MSPFPFASYPGFMPMQPSSMDAEACKSTDTIWLVYQRPSQWNCAGQCFPPASAAATQLSEQGVEPGFQCNNALQGAAWQPLEHSGQPLAHSGFQGTDTWEQNAWQPLEQVAQPCSTLYCHDYSMQGSDVLVSAIHPENEARQLFEQPDTQYLTQQCLKPTALSLQGQVLWQARDPEGCRLVQQALDEATCDEERVALASELRMSVWQALQCPNANHVLQKCIETLRPKDSQFIIDEISGSAPKVARHRYGCRVLQRLFEHCSAAQVQGLVEELLLNGVALATHIYGNFVLQHLLEHGSPSHVVQLTCLLAEHVHTVCEHSYGCAVVGKALAHASSDARAALADALLIRPDMLIEMACSRHGHLTVKLSLQAAEKEKVEPVLAALVGKKHVLARSRYGRVLNKYLDQCSM